MNIPENFCDHVRTEPIRSLVTEVADFQVFIRYFHLFDHEFRQTTLQTIKYVEPLEGLLYTLCAQTPSTLLDPPFPLQ